MTALPLAAVILAGGLARRMGGGDKGLKRIGGETLLDAVIGALRRQSGVPPLEICLNANGEPGRFAAFGLPVKPDPVSGNPGPLAGVLAGLDWAARETDSSHVLSVPCDAPYLPDDLAAKLARPILDGDAEMSCAASGGQAHPVIGIWPVARREVLRTAISKGVRKVDRFTGRFRLAVVDFPIVRRDPFFNANEPGDLKAGGFVDSR